MNRGLVVLLTLALLSACGESTSDAESDASINEIRGDAALAKEYKEAVIVDGCAKTGHRTAAREWPSRHDS